MIRVIFDTNVLITAMRSRLGASYRLLTMLDNGLFNLCVSVPLLFEYEAVLKKDKPKSGLTSKDIDNLLDYLCRVAQKFEIFYLWRPQLRDPKDDFILELAVESGAAYIVTYNLKDFAGSEKFGVKAVTPKDFLKTIGAL